MKEPKILVTAVLSMYHAMGNHYKSIIKGTNNLNNPYANRNHFKCNPPKPPYCSGELSHLEGLCKNSNPQNKKYLPKNK